MVLCSLFNAPLLGGKCLDKLSTFAASVKVQCLTLALIDIERLAGELL